MCVVATVYVCLRVCMRVCVCVSVYFVETVHIVATVYVRACVCMCGSNYACSSCVDYIGVPRILSDTCKI